MTFDPTSATPEGTFDPTSAALDSGPPLETVLQSAMKNNPDQAARANILAKQGGMPMDVAMRNLPAVELQHAVRKANGDLNSAPILALEMRQRLGLADQGHDDIGPLGEIEQFLRDTGGSAKAGVFNASKGAAGVFRAGLELVAPVLDPLESVTAIGGNPLRRLAEGFAMQADAAGSTAKAAAPKTDGMLSGGFQSGIQSLTQNTLMLPMAFLPGGQPAALAGMVSLTGGQSYQDAREKGLTMSQALPFAASQAAIEYATEKIPLGQLIGDVKAGTNILKTLAKQMALEIPGEQVATALQDMNEWAVLNPEKPFRDYIAERPNAAVQTLIATMVGTGGNVMISKGVEAATKRLMGDAYDAGQADTGAEQLKAAMLAAANSKLRERNPDEFRTLVQNMAAQTEGAPADVYVDAEVLNQLAPEVLAQLPGVAAQMQAALAANDVVSIPMADVLTIAPGTPLEQFFTENARVNGPDSMSQAEAKEAGSKAQEFLAQESARVIAQAVDQQAWQASHDAVKQSVLEQLNAVGRFRKEVNEGTATMFAAMYTTIAGERGITPEQAWAEDPIAFTDKTGNGAVLNAGKPGEITVDGYHFSMQDRPTLTTGMFGTGLKGSAREEILNHPDQRLKERLSFYVDKGHGIRPESGVGGRAHRVQLTGVYDSNADPLKLKTGNARELETKLLDLGYSGYLDRLDGTQPGQVIMLGKQNFKAELLGAQSRIESGQKITPIEAAAPQWQTQASGEPTMLAAKLERMQGMPAWGDYDLRIEGRELQARKKSEVLNQGAKPGSDAGHKRESNGRYVGAPDWVGKSSQQLTVLRKNLVKLTKEGEIGRYWYEKSARAVLALTGQDPVAAEKFIGLLAIYSPGTGVAPNTTAALKAWYQWKAGQPITAGRFPVAMGKKAEAWLNKGEDWGGIKTNNFYTDLMEEVDPSKLDEHHSTMDMWMALAGDYGAKVLDQGPKYLFMQREIARIAEQTGWRPHQVQAAIWTAIRARVMGSEIERNAWEEKQGIRIKNDKGLWEYAKGREYDHYRAATRFGLESKITQEEINASDYDFGTALRERSVQMSWEATPGASTGVLPGIHQAPMAQQIEYLVAIRKALSDENGRDLIDQELGLLTSEGDQGFSGWQGKTSVGVQQQAGVTVEDGAVTGESRLRIALAADLRGMLLAQEGMAWHFPIHNGAKYGQNGVEFKIGRPLTEAETTNLYAALSTELGHSYAPPIPTADGFRVLNFPDEKFALMGETDKGKIKDLQKASREKNDAFHDAARRAVEAQTFVSEVSDVSRFETDGELRENDWSKGDADYRARIEAATQSDSWSGRPDLLKWAEDELRPKVDAVNADFTKRYGWDKPAPADAYTPADAYAQEGVSAETLAQGPLGTLNPRTFEVALNPDANLSTVHHEMGHVYLELLARIAARPNPPASLMANLDRFLKWQGIESLEAWNAMTLDQKRPHHEALAEGYEQYLLTGKAPSLELQPLMRKLKAFMLNVYKSLKTFVAQHPNSGMALPAEMVQFYDRMLASEEQITQAEEVAGLLPEQDATAEAIEKLTARSLRDLKWAVNARNKEIKRLQAQAKALRKEVEAEVTLEVNAMPEYQAKEMLDKTRKENKEQLNDTEIAIIADAFGYPTPEDMLRAIDAAGKKSDLIEGMTDQRMLERHGDLIDQRAIEQAANEAVHNEARAKSLATELRSQAEMLNPRTDTGETREVSVRVGKKGEQRTEQRTVQITVNAIVEAAKQFAASVVASTPLRDLKNKAWQHTAAERRAGKRWQEATAAGKTQDAVKAKQDQVLNNAAAKAAMDAQAEMRKILEFFKRVVKDNNEKTVEKGRDPDVVNAARAILGAYGIAPKGAKSAAEYMALVEKNDPVTYADLLPSMQGALNMAQPLEALTMEELRGLHEEIQAMWHKSQRMRQMEVDGNLMDMQDAEDELQNRMQTLGVPLTMPGDSGAVTPREEIARKLQHVGSLLRRTEQWAQGMGAEFTRLVFQPIKTAANAYRSARVVYRKKYQALVDNVAPALTKGLIEATELGYTFGKGHNGIGHAELLHAILHTGNASNKRKLLLGRGWATENADGTLDTARWDAFLTRMHDTGVLNKAHYEFAQGVWDLLEETKPLAQKTHRDVFGRYFAEVTADSFDTPFGSYRGGYVPAQADPRIVQDADLRKLAEAENENMAFSFPGTNKGFTKGRVDYNRPLLLDLRTIGQHIDKVLLFSHMEPAVRDVNKLLTRKGVSYSLGRIDPTIYAGMLTPWLNRSARQVVETPIVGDGGISRVLSAARNRAGMSLMFANVSNTIQQITGFSTAALKVKPSSMMRATSQFIAHPKQTAKAVSDASEFMANRMDNEISAINDAMDAILLDPSLYEKSQAWAQKHAYFMQTAMANSMEPIIWTAAYNDALTEGQSERDAVRHADSVIRTTQGSTLPEDVSRIETGPAYARIFTQFIGYFNMMANTNATALKQIAQEVGLKKGAGKALGVVTLGFLIPIWVAEAIAQAMRGGPDDPDKDGYLDDWLAAVFGMGTLKGSFAMVPFIGQLANSAINRFNGNPADDKMSLSPAVSLLEGAVGVPVDVYKAITDPDKLNKRNAVRDVASLVSIATGLPAVAVAKPLGYLAGVASDKVNPTSTLDAVRGTVTGTPSPASR